MGVRWGGKKGRKDEVFSLYWGKEHVCGMDPVCLLVAEMEMSFSSELNFS